MHFQLRPPRLPEQVAAERHDGLAGDLGAHLALELPDALVRLRLRLRRGLARAVVRVTFHLHTSDSK